MRNIGNHTVDGVEPGDEFGKLDEPTARRRARQGSVSWDDYKAAVSGTLRLTSADLSARYVCETCGFEAKSPGGLGSHERSHEEAT